MTSENDTLPVGGTENATPSEPDTSNDWDYYDPDEDQDTADTPKKPETESEDDNGQEAESAEDDDEGTDDQDTDEDTDENSDEDDDPDETESKAINDDVKITIEGYGELPLSEVKKGYLRQADYSRKTLETAEKAKTINAQAERVTRTVDAFASFLADQIPPEPPHTLAMTDHQAYVTQKAMHDAAMQQVNALLQMGAEPKAVVDSMSAEERQAKLLEENEKLIAAFPETSVPEKRQKFFQTAIDAAQAVGFSEAESKGHTDHRIYALAYWAKKGMAAEEARKAAKAKVASAPPAAPSKRQKGTDANAKGNREAMRRLSKTGSIEDALLVDWD